MKKYLLFLLVFAFLACEDDPPGFPDEPKIEIVSVNPSVVQEFESAVELVIRYEDGNGDLGFSHPDSLSLSVWDDRLSAPDMYHVQPLAPDGADVDITGTLTIVLNGTFIIGSGSSETTRYAVKIKDRAGNWSNEERTGPITIVK